MRITVRLITIKSPSPRREWIEIFNTHIGNECRLMSPSPRREWIEIFGYNEGRVLDRSPSPRREWIEISTAHSVLLRVHGMSPSPRREWIEIADEYEKRFHELASPSPRREWIEIIKKMILQINYLVSLPTEGVD